MLRALVAGIGVALIAGVIGCFVVWRRMAYFGDSLSHSALLGVAFGLFIGINTNISTILVCALFAVILLGLQHKRILATDTLLGILAHAALSIGMVVIALLGQRIDLNAYLFGDVLTVTSTQVWWIYGGGAVAMALVIKHWSSLVLMTLHEDLARAEGVRVLHMHALLIFLVTLVVGVSIHILGVLLVTSMLIIPAAAARQWARSPEEMAILSSITGALAVILGLYGSFLLDTPSGPSIVVAAVFLFFIFLIISTFLSRENQ